jgi:hypothetical protein
MSSEPTGSELRSGDLLFCGIGGFVPGFVPVGVGQLALFVTRKWWRVVFSARQWFHLRHVAVVDVTRTYPYLIQAMPRGAERVPLDPAKHLTAGCVYVRPEYEPDWDSDLDGAVTGRGAADAAWGYVGVPYGFLTYLKLAAGAFRMRLTEAWLRKALSTRRDMICSQLADQALADAGHHVFDDGRLPQDVVPAELFDAVMSQPGWFMIPGHPVVGQWTRTDRASSVFARK